MKKHFKDFKEMVIVPSIKLVKWSMILLFFFILFSSFTSALTGYEYLANNTMGYYELENNMNNTVPLLPNLTDNNTGDTYGKILRGRIFDANTDALTFPNGFQNYTWTNCFWLNVSSVGVVFERANSTERTQTTLWLDTKYNYYRTRRGVASDCTTGFGNVHAGVSQFVCLIYTPGLQQVYINATLLQNCSSTFATASTVTPDYMIFGAGGLSGVTTFRGTIDEVSYWNKSLNQSEVSYLYASTNPGKAQQYPYNYTLADNSTVTFISQSPSDITTTNAVNGINITYNFSINGFNVTSPYLNWSIKNSSGSIIYSYLNGSILSGYHVTPYSNYTGASYRFFLDDNIYPGTYNVNHTTMSNTVHYNYSLTTINNMLKVQFLNFTGKKYNIIEVDITTSSASTFTDAYYCNSSYVSGLPLASGNCAFIGSYNFSTVYNHCHNKSCHNLFSMSVSNNSFNSITISDISYILVSGAGAGTVQVGYINGSARTNVSMSTTNRGLSWSNEAFTIDAHLHFYNDNDYLEYTAYGTNATNLFYVTPSRTDSFNITYLPPSGVTVTLNSYDNYYDTNILVTRTSSTGFTGNISYYKYSVYNVNLTLYDTLNASTNLTSLTFTPSNYTSGTYYVGVLSVDTNGYSSLSFSEAFTVHTRYTAPCNETVTLNSTGVPVYFNFTRNTRNETVTIYGRVGLLNYSLVDEPGDNVFISTTPITTYDLFVQENINTALDCSLTFCVNTWSKINNPCTNGLRLINYSYSCAIPYDNPYNDTGLYEDCTSPANTDKSLWLILILLAIWLIGIILALTYQPLIMILVMIVSFALAYYTSEYFNEPVVSLGIIVISAFMFFVATRINTRSG